MTVYKSLYLHRASPVHALDPRAKLLGLLALAGLPFAFNDPRYVAVVGLIVLGLSAVAGCLGNLRRFRNVYLLVFVVNVVLWQFTIDGATTLFVLGPVSVTREALLYGIAAALRFVVVLMVGTLFVSCTSTEDVTVGLVHLRLPYTVAFVVSTTLRLVPAFVTATGTVIEAQTARGFVADSRNPVRRVRQLLPVVVPLIVYALRHGSMMSLAMEARGFTVRGDRTSYRTPVMTARDVAVLGGLAIILAGAIHLRLSGYGVVLPGRL
ncbi:energy-coupling factor transporter transmembrane component T [Micromonospora sp. NPDC047793]|uniref:energy-coupling factor transporter transmembrane component T family protein n=1 Tax=unclassified Micromonospora TaxID=2617518 RepID=UPI001034BB0A|nr:energy-coupling factor transporter transmembrane component T [Verrucosispora sp. SN26_14.1]TBL45566.1 energy-coupling factor transporter transmembrane protein EcfT [Verrucosispora sp. SN26_14.1]